MREIKFRGKRVDNGEWVYGWYIKAKGHWNNKGIHEDWIICQATQNGGWFALGAKHAVIPETVGQYTGLHDKNGVEIYEGDVVIITYERWRKYSVEYWGKDFGSYVLVKDGKYFESDLADYSDLEVIGNIHDKVGDE